MENPEKIIEIRLLRIIVLRFTNQSPLFCIIMTVIAIVGVLAMLLIIKAYILPVLATAFAEDGIKNAGKIIKSIKGASP